MPNKTFLNLSVKRQQAILMVAYEEFALHDFKTASLSSIIKKLGLAKGSFYRYFSSKKELYAYLISDGRDRRLANLDQLLNKDVDDFFSLLEDNFMAKVRFDLDHPVIGGFLYRIMLEKNNSDLKEIIEDLFKDVLDRIKDILNLPSFKKQIGKFDTELLAFNILNMQLGLYDFISRKYGINYEENIKNNQPVLSLSITELKKVIREQISILKNGIKA